MSDWYDRYPSDVQKLLAAVDEAIGSERLPGNIHYRLEAAREPFDAEQVSSVDSDDTDQPAFDQQATLRRQIVRLQEAIERAGLTVVPDDSPDAYEHDEDVPLRLDPLQSVHPYDECPAPGGDCGMGHLPARTVDEGLADERLGAYPCEECGGPTDGYGRYVSPIPPYDPTCVKCSYGRPVAHDHAR